MTAAMQETFRSFFPAARTSSTVLEVEFHPDMSPRPGPLEQGALDSPKKLEELDKEEEVCCCHVTLRPQVSASECYACQVQAALRVCARCLIIKTKVASKAGCRPSHSWLLES